MPSILFGLWSLDPSSSCFLRLLKIERISMNEKAKLNVPKFMANDSFGVLHVCKLEGKSVSSTFVETAKFSWHILVTKIFCILLKIMSNLLFWFRFFGPIIHDNRRQVCRGRSSATATFQKFLRWWRSWRIDFRWWQLLIVFNPPLKLFHLHWNATLVFALRLEKILQLRFLPWQLPVKST